MKKSFNVYLLVFRFILPCPLYLHPPVLVPADLSLFFSITLFHSPPPVPPLHSISGRVEVCPVIVLCASLYSMPSETSPLPTENSTRFCDPCVIFAKPNNLSSKPSCTRRVSDVNHCDPLIISFSDLSLLCLTPALPPALSCLVLLYLGFRRLRCGKKKKPSPFDCPITTTHTPLPTAPPTRHLQDSRCQPLVNHQPRHH